MSGYNPKFFEQYLNTVIFFFAEHLDFMNQSNLPDNENAFVQINHEYIGYQSLTDVPKALSYVEQKISLDVSNSNCLHNNFYLRKFIS